MVNFVTKSPVWIDFIKSFDVVHFVAKSLAVGGFVTKLLSSRKHSTRQYIVKILRNYVSMTKTNNFLLSCRMFHKFQSLLQTLFYAEKYDRDKIIAGQNIYTCI